MTSIFFRTAIIYVLLSFSMKVMGKREIGELEVGELITTLLLSEICSIPIDDPNIPLINAIIPVLFIVSLEIILSHIKNKSLRLKRIVDGRMVFLIKNGQINRDALIDNRISLEEFFCALRQNGAGGIADIQNCILEANGKISVLDRSTDMEYIIISDGEINTSNLKRLKLNDGWLREKLDCKKVDDVFLMTASEHGCINIILKGEKK